MLVGDAPVGAPKRAKGAVIPAKIKARVSDREVMVFDSTKVVLCRGAFDNCERGYEPDCVAAENHF